MTKRLRHVAGIKNQNDSLVGSSIYFQMSMIRCWIYSLGQVFFVFQYRAYVVVEYAHLEFMVILFGLLNVPTMFQHMMNDVFRKYLHHFVVVYLNDILLFSPILEEFTHHVLLILSKPHEYELYGKIEKCEFDCIYVAFIGYVSHNGIFIAGRKVTYCGETYIPI